MLSVLVVVTVSVSARIDKSEQNLRGYMLFIGAYALPVAGQRTAVLSLLVKDWHRVIRYGLNIAEDTPGRYRGRHEGTPAKAADRARGSDTFFACRKTVSVLMPGRLYKTCIQGGRYGYLNKLLSIDQIPLIMSLEQKRTYLYTLQQMHSHKSGQ